MAKYLHNGGIVVGKGNTKTHDSILIFNLPAIKTCPNCSQCASSCYAMKAERNYPSVRGSRQSNWDSSKRPCFVPRMVELINRSGLKVVRVHESGDFYSQEYADKWSRIAALCPNVKFFAYTKSPYRPVGSNWNIVESILPDGSINFGPRALITQKAKQYRAKICPYGIAKKAHTCGLHCTACQTHKYVVFVQH